MGLGTASGISRIISIHAPRVGSDFSFTTSCAQFNYFYPRSPRGERLGDLGGGDLGNIISIHAPRVGSDGCRGPQGPRHAKFLSTLPAWGATDVELRARNRVHISIHAPRVGSDHIGNAIDAVVAFISIHAPRVGSDRLVRE